MTSDHFVREPAGRVQSTAGADVLFAATLALVSAVVGYRFASGNQLEQLPIILRQLDPGYLTADPFVNASAGFGPRFYFAWIVSSLAVPMPLHWVYATLRLVADLALVLVTTWTARRVIGSDTLGARIAAVLTVAVSAIHLGDATELRYYVFQPASLAIPGMLLAVAFGLAGRPLAAAVAASVASVPHPLYGIYGGATGLLTAFAVMAWPSPSNSGHVAWWPAARRTAAAAALFALAVAGLWWWPGRSIETHAPLSTAELFDILGRFRSPHHYLPSAFRRRDYLILTVFAWTTWLVYSRWRTSVPHDRAGGLLVPLGVVAAACFAGAVFTEIWEVGGILTLQPFRLLSILKWMTFLLVGWQLSIWWHQPPNPAARAVVALTMISAGAAHPLVAGGGLPLVRWFDRMARPVARVALLIFVAAAALTAYQFAPVNEQARLLVCAACLALSTIAGRPGGIIAAGVACALAVALSLNPTDATHSEVAPWRPTISAGDLHDPDAVTARAAAEVSEETAVFVAPPQFGILRVVGRRALVVDFEAIPFGDQAMRDWRERVRQVYGETDRGGHRARAALEDAYHRITDDHLVRLASRFGATHAVLYADTATTLPVLYANSTYRIVRLAR